MAATPRNNPYNRPALSPFHPAVAHGSQQLFRPAAEVNDSLVAASKNSFQPDNSLDLSEYYALANNATVGENEFQTDIASHAIAATKKYLGKQNAVVTAFVEAAAENPSLTRFVELVEDPRPRNKGKSQELVGNSVGWIKVKFLSFVSL